jgi:hypothetical protein
VLRDRRGFHALYTAKTTQMVVTLPAGEADGQVQRYELDYSDGECVAPALALFILPRVSRA